MLKELEGYLRNIDNEFSLLDLTDAEYRRRYGEWANRSSREELEHWKARIQNLVGYIQQCVTNEDDVAIQMLIDMRNVTRLATEEWHDNFRPALQEHAKSTKARILGGNKAKAARDERDNKRNAYIDKRYRQLENEGVVRNIAKKISGELKKLDLSTSKGHKPGVSESAVRRYINDSVSSASS